MKKINSLLIGVSILFAGFFTTSCNKDTTNDATIGLVAGTGYITESTSVTAGSTLKFKWTATSTPNMKYISIARDGVALSGDGWSMKEINSSYENAYNGEASLTAPLSGGPYVYSIIVYDKDQTELARVEVTITIQSSTTMATEKTGVIYHIQASTGNGAWDLVSDVARMSGDAAANKDMIQASDNTSGSAWVSGWNVGAGNSTTFVKANSFDYANATVETAKSTFTAGTASNQIRNVATNDIYIAKLRGQDTYAVIKITNVDPTDASHTSGSNPGSISFSYKKQ